jgi:hypothetical protein
VSRQETRRGKRLIDRSFQLALASRLLLAVVLCFFVGLALMFAPSFYLLATTNDPKSLEEAAKEFLVLHRRIWPAALLAFGGLFVYSLWFSNRIAGPIYRINAVLGQLLRDEHPEKVTFREKDYFLPTAALLEQLSEKLRNPPGRPPGNSGNDPSCARRS